MNPNSRMLAATCATCLGGVGARIARIGESADQSAIVELSSINALSSLQGASCAFVLPNSPAHETF